MKKRPRTNKEIIAGANAMAREFYEMHGFQSPEGFRFDKAPRSRERGMWDLACVAFEAIEGTDVESALAEEES